MPLTPFQREVMVILAANRSEESHVAGGLVLNATSESARFSSDFDFFHETAEAVSTASSKDKLLLEAAGYEVVTEGEWEKVTTFRQAKIKKADDSVEIDWAADSAFRYFPIEPDPLLGWKLHLFDMATNKALALSARTETRDYVDIVELSKIYPLSAICWAACGKDPGFSPLFLLKMMLRFARINPMELEKIQARNLDPIELKKQWIEMSDQADAEMERIANEQPELPIGCAFLNPQGEASWPGTEDNLVQHFPSVRGCIPVIRRS